MKATLLLLLMTVGMATPAQACRGSFSHRYVVLTDPPLGLPQGAVLLRVRLIEQRSPFDWKQMATGLSARVLAGGGLWRKVVRLRSEIWTSCSGLGPVEGYVVGFLDKSRSGSVTVDVVEYRDRQFRTPDEEWSRGYVRPEPRT